LTAPCDESQSHPSRPTRSSPGRPGFRACWGCRVRRGRQVENSAPAQLYGSESIPSRSSVLHPPRATIPMLALSRRRMDIGIRYRLRDPHGTCDCESVARARAREREGEREKMSRSPRVSTLRCLAASVDSSLRLDYRIERNMKL